MVLPSRSLEVVGADYPNRKGPTRRFEIAVCLPGEPVELRPEPKNPADPSAVAVYSQRGVQLGYLTASRCGQIGALLRNGAPIRAAFQEATRSGAAIRVTFDGSEPVLPPPSTDRVPEQDWWPDEEPPDEYL